MVDGVPHHPGITLYPQGIPGYWDHRTQISQLKWHGANSIYPDMLYVSRDYP